MRLALGLALALSAGAGGSRDDEGESPSARAEPAVELGSGAPLTARETKPRLAPVRVHEPYEDRGVTFLALPLEELLDERFGEDWREADEVLFICADGYRAGVPVRRLLAHRPHLAFERVGAEFAIDRSIGGVVRHVPLAPAYLIWERPPARESDGLQEMREASLEWPYQIVRVELASLADRYARITPEAPASAEVTRGFEEFRRYCVRCHAINGQGGELGPELNYPASVTEYMREEWLLRFILEPTSVRHGTAMPGLPAGLPDREARARDVVAYLEAMAMRKLAPEPG